ncbi:hypothetical protein AB9K34_07725 [Sedimentitalea sp. XS_ASV28]|uniref:hypothetical protein n=1 Tax=Sedimentitalea sp. XS_ASV28 TaxID=3241296 RepID=UPI0035134EA1
MTQTESGRWHLNGVTPEELLLRLPGMGRLMVIFRENGVTHERIGLVETAAVHDGKVTLGGDCHDAKIEPAALSGVVFDTGSEMQGRVYPRIEFIADGDAPVVAVVGMDGPDPFVSAVGGAGRSTASPRGSLRPSDMSEQSEPETDPGHIFLNGLQGAEVEITARRSGFSQAWQGRVEAVKPSMGFSNIMTSDFHLHLKAGSVSDWQEEDGETFALDEKGRRTGLAIRRVGVSR